MCHVVNLVVQAILATLGEADNPDDVDYYTLNKEQPLHLDINADPDQIALDQEEFPDDIEDDSDAETSLEENIMLEEEEKLKATDSVLSKVCISAVKLSFSWTDIHVSYAASQTKSSHHPSDGRSFENAQSQYIARKTRSTRIKEGP